jgi:CheY-like chemotaxis protein
MAALEASSTNGFFQCSVGGPQGCERRHPETTPESEQENGRRQVRVLVVDDIPLNRLLACAMLESLDLSVECVADGREALARLSEGEPVDLVLMDLQMPGMDGYMATREIRRLGLTVPVVALTACEGKAFRDQARAAGLDDFVVKPASLLTLREVLRRWGPGPQ